MQSKWNQLPEEVFVPTPEALARRITKYRLEGPRRRTEQRRRKRAAANAFAGAPSPKISSEPSLLLLIKRNGSVMVLTYLLPLVYDSV